MTTSDQQPTLTQELNLTMARKPKKAPLRDDAQEQPESGYPDGRLSTKPSAAPANDEEARRRRAGSESEFDSKKPQS
jgi:hypothetical protein